VLIITKYFAKEKINYKENFEKNIQNLKKTSFKTKYTKNAEIYELDHNVQIG